MVNVFMYNVNKLLTVDAAAAGNDESANRKQNKLNLRVT